MIAYRPDIDGLRAIAVSAVVLHHATPEAVPGGYIGVDIFFVISGYLIGNVLLREHATGGISLLNFYHRRIIRIIPAYYVALFVTYLAGLFLLMPKSLESLAASVQQALIFGSNFWFARRVDYFDEASMYQFLLHTWSLSVEEQFYIVFPVLLIAAAYSRVIQPVTLILVLLIASLLATWITYDTEPTRAYFWPHLRAWEILFGTLLAAFPNFSIKNSLARNSASWSGIRGMHLVRNFSGVSCLIVATSGATNKSLTPQDATTVFWYPRWIKSVHISRGFAC